MSWPGEQEQAPPPQSGGGGRRRRRDSPPEDPYLDGQTQGGTGRRGSGEFARPPEYVQYAEEQAAGYDQGTGYADPLYFQQSAPHQPYNLNSSGFYPITEAVPQPAPEPVPEQPHHPYAEPEPVPEQPHHPYTEYTEYTEPSRFITQPRDPEPDRPTPTPEADGDVSDWLHFVESRADQRAERSRRLRLRLIALGVVVALVAVGGGLWFFLSGGDGVKATQTTVLFQVRDQDGNAVGNAVLVAAKDEVGGKVGATGKGAALLIPSELAVESTGLESQPFGGAMPSAVPAGKDAVTTLLGIDVDGVWSMDEFTLAALIDNLIGVTVDVDVPIPGKDGKVLVPAGKAQQLSGAKAVLFATYHGKDEAPAKQLARFGAVIGGVLAKIPTSPVTTTAILNNLGVVPDPALPTDRLSAILAALAAEQHTGRFGQDALPLRADGSGLIDLAAASPIVARLLGGATHEKDNGGLTRVAVSDATGRADTVSSRAMATSKLLNGGYTPLDTGTQGTAPASYVQVPNDGARTLGKQVAVTLGLPDTAVMVVPFDTTLAEALVVLGEDWTGIAQVPADQAPTPSAPPDPAGSPRASASAPGGSPSKTGSRPTKPTTSKTR